MIDLIKQQAPVLFSYMPERYFEFSQASLIYVKYGKLKYETKDFSTYETQFKQNQFRNNRHIQAVAMSSPYRGSLILSESDLPLSRFSFEQNIVENNAFIGLATRLIEIDGGIIQIERNTIRNNGYLSKKKYENHPDSTLSLFVVPVTSFAFTQYLLDFS